MAGEGEKGGVREFGWEVVFFEFELDAHAAGGLAIELVSEGGEIAEFFEISPFGAAGVKKMGV
jgi:hypothetical protein